MGQWVVSEVIVICAAKSQHELSLSAGSQSNFGNHAPV